MLSNLVLALQFLKRFLINLPNDVLCWVRFYHKRALESVPELIELERNGCVEFGHSLSSDNLKLLFEVMGDHDFEAAMLKEGQDTGRISANSLLDQRLDPIVQYFWSIAQGYLNTSRIKLELTYFQLSRPQSRINDVPGGEFHVDDNKPNIKFFVYLSDVGPLNGPFKAIPGSHGLNMKKIMRFIRWSLLKKRSDLYADKDFGLEAADAIPIVGDKGFCFAVDTTAWHMADPVISGERKVFVCSFNMI